MASQGKRLPAAHEFSPGQVEFKDVLDIVASKAGDGLGIKERLRERYFATSAPSYVSNPDERKIQQLKRAGNILIAMQTYGLYSSKTASLTPLGLSIQEEKSPSRQFELFAGHILKDLHGIEVVGAIRTIQRRGQPVTKHSLHLELVRCGFDLPRATTHHLLMVAWLRKAGVFSGTKGYLLDESRYEALVGVTDTVIHEYRQLDYQKQRFLVTLFDHATINPPNTIFSTKEIVDSCEFKYGKLFARGDALRRELFNPLEESGWVEFENLTKGRGGKAGSIRATSKLLQFDRSILSNGSINDIPPDVNAALEKNTQVLLRELASTNTHVKGLALEAMAVRLVTDLGLEPIRLRERSSTTGGAEVDLIADGVGLHYSRWLCQCKNTKQVTLADLAREVGMATMMKAHVVLLVTTGKFAGSVHEFAQELARNTPLQAVLISGEVLRDYSSGGAKVLLERLFSIASITRTLKRPQAVQTSDATEEESDSTPAG